MKIASGLRDVPLEAAAEHAGGLEALGFDVLWCNETTADPFLVLAQMALGTERATIAPNVAIAFARSPFSMALAAWDIQRASRGRLRPRTRAPRCAPTSSGASRPSSSIPPPGSSTTCTASGQSGAPSRAARVPSTRGRFYRFTLINDFFNPGPIEHPDIPSTSRG